MSDCLKMSTRDRIMHAAWELFQKNGYEETTISQIINASGTSRSAFYHHYRGKEELLFSIAYLYDQDYNAWLQNLSPVLHTVDKLKAFCTFVMQNLEDSPLRTFFPVLYACQVTTLGKRHIINPERKYFRVISLLLKEGIIKHEIESSLSYADLTSLIANQQIGITYAWLLNQGSFSLTQYGERLLNPFLESLRA